MWKGLLGLEVGARNERMSAFDAAPLLRELSPETMLAGWMRATSDDLLGEEPEQFPGKTH